jgi:hypothetical protein
MLMKKEFLNIILKEMLWLVAIVVVSSLIEFTIIELFELHPVLSIKIQALIGLMIFGYSIRMFARLWRIYHRPANPGTNEQEV